MTSCSSSKAGFGWYLTGSEAMAADGSPRQTMDVDIVVAATGDELDGLAERLRSSHYHAEPLRIGNHTMASLTDRAGAVKVDLISRDADPWGTSAMERRVAWAHPSWGPLWNSTLEDLIIAELEWSEGTSELRLRDCRALLRMNADVIDRADLARWSGAVGVGGLLETVPAEAPDAT